ncbi:hypothetical protein M409DRAFT_71392 [Zasmidium cellare ATCC 36951]|uniref:Uncharacterized protein n=1 Tax=Zasmidium cellare ATCC 36951 TaxID=1080233 RepID=A0A6A6BW35_ZASCE|nr:uncharacterized protein M409DRAFT_71392 [Zasmidium cellare ATCC 36951]KAF2158915.1 hypothetical protein M409DRAFT_71392 [Zasmidium cellare ATCC 36951]
MSNKKVAIVVGASRGIGRQVAIDLAKNGYAVVVAAKTTSDASKCDPFPPDPNSFASTINTVAREITEAGGTATALQVDVRSPSNIADMVAQTVHLYARIDVVVYNSGAIWWSSVAKTPFKRFELMQKINPQGLYAVVEGVLPVMYKNGGDGGGGKGEGRIIVISPPIYSRFFKGKTAYAMGKVGMSVLTMGLAVDFEREGRVGMGVTSLWPAVAIDSAATQTPKSYPPQDGRANLRKPEIFSDAILSIIKAPSKDVSGKCFLDEDYLREHDGVQDFGKYALVPGTNPRRIMPLKMPDLTVEEQDDEGVRVDSAMLRGNRDSKL